MCRILGTRHRVIGPRQRGKWRLLIGRRNEGACELEPKQAMITCSMRKTGWRASKLCESSCWPCITPSCHGFLSCGTAELQGEMYY